MRLRAGRVTLYVTRRWRLGRHVQWTMGHTQSMPVGPGEMPEQLRHIPLEVARELGLIPPAPVRYTEPKPKWRAWYMGWLELRVRC